MAMEFWGIEVNSKGPCKVTLEEDYGVHLSQATLGEMKKDGEPVMVHVKVGDQKLVLGVLSKTTPQLSMDLVFEKEFEISHNWKNGTVHLMGYKTVMGQPEDDGTDDMFFDSSDEEGMDLPVLQKQKNGTAAAPAPAPAPAKAAAPKAVAKQGKGNKFPPEVKDDSDEDDSDDEDDDDDEDDSEEDMQIKSDDSDADLDDEDSKEETPAKPESGKKRPNVEAKTPESKKAKLVTPQKTDRKKGAHTATPHPSKKGGKTPGDKATPNPKSGGQVSCEPCKKTFNSDFALESHNKAKHSAK